MIKKFLDTARGPKKVQIALNRGMFGFSKITSNTIVITCQSNFLYLQ